MRFIIFASLMLTSAAASAAPAQTDTSAEAAAFKGTRGAVKVFDFENDTVSGDALKPEGADVQSRPRSNRESMIRVRMHFIPQMLQMANDV